MPKPKPKRGRPATGRMRETPIQTQLTDEDTATVQSIAADKGISVSSLVRMIVKKFLNGDRAL